MSIRPGDRARKRGTQIRGTVTAEHLNFTVTFVFDDIPSGGQSCAVIKKELLIKLVPKKAGIFLTREKFAAAWDGMKEFNLARSCNSRTFEDLCKSLGLGGGK